MTQCFIAAAEGVAHPSNQENFNFTVSICFVSLP